MAVRPCLFALLTGVVSQSWVQSPLIAAQVTPSNGRCRYLPGDSNWPGGDQWAKLNSTVEGRLIQTIPMASVCHDPTYDQEECESLQRSWLSTLTHENSSSSFMMPWLQVFSCNPWSPRTQPCQLGSLVPYSINVSQTSDVVAGLHFAEQNSIRLVIKNTGHDYLGKSTGQGGLGLWMHSLKSSAFLDQYQSSYYTGPAFQFGAGVVAYEAYEVADALGYRVVGGECPTVGIAGGHAQAGGHSLLSSLYGLGADQVLEWEVVTPQGQRLVATPDTNSDLYWALAGGGGGTYGVVLSVTVRAHRDGVVGGANFVLSQADVSNETYWEAVEYFQSGIPQLVDSGSVVIYSLSPGQFLMNSISSPGATVSDVRSQLSYFTDYLEAREIPYSLNATSYPKYLDHFKEYYGPLPEGNVNPDSFLASRLLPRSTIEERNNDIITTARNILDVPSFYVLFVALNVTGKNVADNAVLPAWREALLHMVIDGPWNYTGSADIDAFETELVGKLNPMLDQLAPESGAYMNEANFKDANWKEDFYGANYEKLRAIKAKYDPTDLLYATTAVGSDAWVVAEDGRLCRA